MAQISEPQIGKYRHSDDLSTHYRHWGAKQGRDVILILHGAMSHSGWQAPVAEAVVSSSPIAVVASDRRGSGLNEEGRGDAEVRDRNVDDIIELVRHLRGSFDRVHLAGWCLGAQLASVAAARLVAQGEIASLILIAPAFFFGHRYGDVLRRSTESVLEVVREFGIEVPPSQAYIPIPLRPEDFTTSSSWQEFIANDPLRVTKLTQRALFKGFELSERARTEFPGIARLPVLAVLAAQDRLINNDEVKSFLQATAVGSEPLIIETFDTGHAVQFEQPEPLAQRMISFINGSGHAMDNGQHA